MVVETVAADGRPDLAYRLQAVILEGELGNVTFGESSQTTLQEYNLAVALDSIFECRIPLDLLAAGLVTILRVRFSLWRDRLPLDALPQEGAIEVKVVPEMELSSLPYAKP